MKKEISKIIHGYIFPFLWKVFLFIANIFLQDNNKKEIYNYTKRDLAKLILYICFFSILFFGYNFVYSPESEKTLNSASVFISEYQKNIEKEEKVAFEIWQKKQKNSTLSIQFNPDYTKINSDLLKAIKLNIDSKYFKEKVTPLSLVIDNTKLDPRWQVVGKKLTLSNKIKEMQESIKVFIHELWHIVDLHYLLNTWDYDPSEGFYKISWIDYNIKKKWAKLEDFVSWYALTNKYEDFAECFGFYVFHNEEFLKRAKNNEKLLDKYNFLKNKVFTWIEFRDTTFWAKRIASYNWDTTKIPINFKKYLYYIK